VSGSDEGRSRARERRIDRVVIPGSRDATSVTIPWASRGVLLVRLRQEDGASEVVRAFETVGSHKSVRLDRSAKRRLLETSRRWTNEVGVDKLPEGIFDLGNALEAEQQRGELDDGGRLKSFPPRADTEGAA
jgi:hypothetical protein